MRILWVKAGRLLPVDTGGKIRSFNILRRLAERHETVVLSYYDGAPDPQYERALADALPGAIALATGAPAGSIMAQAAHYLARVFHPAPYAVTKFTSPIVRRRVGELLASGRFDVAVCDFLAASLNFPGTAPIPVILFQHNVESALWARRVTHEGNPVKRIAFAWEALKMRRYETAAVGRFDGVIAVSSHDRDLMRAMTRNRITVVPTGVDTAQYRRPAGSTGAGDARTVLFLGSMDWEPNIDGVEFFCRDIWPQVLAVVPDARFRIVGRNPHPRVRRLATDTVEVTGSVPTVVEHLHDAAVVVVPLRVGGGTRLKIYEAMAAGRAVISTTVGAEGLDITHGEDIILADDADAFARGVIEVLSDRERRVALEERAEALAAKYDWSTIAASFADALTAAGVVHNPVAGAARGEGASVPAT
jgi:polysaccharide biosynthesis protein PslH